MGAPLLFARSRESRAERAMQCAPEGDVVTMRDRRGGAVTVGAPLRHLEIAMGGVVFDDTQLAR